MDDGGTSKAPLTRLRRRLSVEVEEVKSPAEVSTPTKKRGGRITAKPQLDLIEENETDTLPKKTAVKPLDEKTLTPSRRSARIKSNTSITFDAINYDSPRAKRAAARRTSQAGSDNETSPTKPKPRTRKNSTSSITKQAETTITTETSISETVIKDKESPNEEKPNETNDTTRKSPRLVGKMETNKTLQKSSSDIIGSEIMTMNKRDESNENQKSSIENDKPTEFPVITENSSNEDNDITKDKEADLNNSCDILLKKLSEKSQNVPNHKNKSLTDLELSNNFSNKRHRTKSWTTVSVKKSDCDNFYSDNEVSKKTRKNKSLNNSGSGDNVSFITKSDKNKSVVEVKGNTEDLPEKVNSPLGNLNNNPEKSKLSTSKGNPDSDTLTQLFKSSPNIRIQSIVVVEDDSQLNTDILSKDKQSDGQDQCVPVVNQANSDFIKNNISYEPMDVDETLPENISKSKLYENNSANLSSLNKPLSLRKSLIEHKVANNSANISERKSSGTYSESQYLEKSNIENKSKLILSQIKDTPTNDNDSLTVNDNDQTSQSINVSGTTKNKNINKENISQNYLTSTPLQQKLFPKLSMQLDSSLISPKNVTETKSHESIDNNEKEKKESISKKSNDDSSQATSEEESEKESAIKQNSLIDDEAEQASDEYESGDSQNEEDRQYEKDNEIIEKGETIETEDDFSDDSEYEKDSFVVSSAEEDNDLLSGSGDNLSMSDNELTMSTKSKTKFDQRKIKEQKRVSREMYNARHILSDSQSSNDISQVKKKPKRQRLNSSALKSDDDQNKSQETGKNNNENSVTGYDLEDISIKKKKKVKRLSESMYDDEVQDEKEITLLNTTKIEKVDPLLVQIKEETQTPYKNLNISTVLVNDAVEEVNVNENISVMNVSEKLDPLQATIAEDVEFSSSNENEEITENYNSVLKDLQNKNIKSFDISLDAIKTQKKETEPIVEQLNLTSTIMKKNKNMENYAKIDYVPESNTKSTDKSIVLNAEETSSDTINMRLLFHEDSNDSESENNVDTSTKNYIPLKKTEGKTDIRASMDNELVEDVGFFIDTKGDRDEDSSTDTTMKHSPKKSTQKKNSIDLSKIKNENIETTSNGKKKKSLVPTNTTSEDKVREEECGTFDIIFSVKKNKKGKLSHNASELETSTQINLEDFDNHPVETVTLGDKKKKKHSKKHNTENSVTDVIEVQDAEPDMSIDTPINLKSSAKKKKKAKKSNSFDQSTVETDALELDEAPLEVLYKNNKSKNRSVTENLQSDVYVESIQTEEMAVEEESANTSTSKKKKKKSKKLENSIDKSVDIEIKEDLVEEAPTETSYQTNKKKKHDKQPNDITQTFGELEDDLDEEAPTEISYQSNRKKKHNKQANDIVQENIETDAKREDDIITETIAEANNKRKKYKKSHILDDNVETHKDDFTEEVPTETTNKSNKKKKHYKPPHDDQNTVVIHTEGISVEDVNKEEVTSKKRKREYSLTQTVSIEDNPTSVKSHGNDRKKIKKSQSSEDIGEGTSKKGKKRKMRDDDELENNQSSIDEVHRLPSHIIEQLEDKPRKNVMKKKKPRLISTTDFVVEEQNKAKRNKPSNYLEETICLNDTTIVKKQKKIFSKPKVLPSIPTALTSYEGFTSNFKINVIPRDYQFVAQSSNITDFKTDFLQNSKSRKFRKYENYQNQKKFKISKY